MKAQRQSAQEGPPKVPVYIVTYSDMVTLLLTFFVMLLALANVQDPELFHMGRGSFIQSVRGLGLGMLYGRKPRPDLRDVKIKYFISRPDESPGTRTIHAKEEELRRIFEKVNQSMTTMPSQIAAERSVFSVTNIRFSPGQASLDKSAKRFLTEFCLSLQRDTDSRAGTLYVLGLAGEPVTDKQQWIVSACRAQAVADFLRGMLQQGSERATGNLEFRPAGPAWHVCWWGAGPGGDWVGQDSPVSGLSQILIAVLRDSA